MFSFLKFLKKARTHGSNLIRRFRTRLRVEELESRTLLSVFTPVQIRHAYGADNIAFPGSLTGDGSGQTIALIDAYYDPSITTDLATFSQTYNLPALDGQSGRGTFTQVDLSNGTRSPAGDDWTAETALDVEWAHAIAPKANITLIEAASDNQDPVTGEPTDLLNAVTEAVSPTQGEPAASVVSMSWGLTEVPNEASWDSFFTAPGVTFVAASGDSGAGTIWPAVSPNVVSVGGTTLRLTSSNTIAGERGWGYGIFSSFFGGSGGGISQYEPLPTYQQNIPTVTSGFRLTDFNARLNPDVAYNADPGTGYNVLDGAAGGWLPPVGGTSAGSPQWAGLIAIADQGRVAAGGSTLSSSDTLSALYNISANSTSYASDFHDITQGSTGAYDVYDNSGNFLGTLPVRAQTGYDMVTGLGTPSANTLIPDLATTGMSPARAIGAAKSGSGTSSGHGSGSKPKDVLNPGDTSTVPGQGNNPTVSLSATTANLLLAIVGGVQAKAVSVTPVSTATFTVSTAGTAVLPATVLLAPSPTFGGRTGTSTGPDFGGLDINSPDTPSTPDQKPASKPPMAPDKLPAAPARQDQTPGMSDTAPLPPDVMDAGFLPEESLTAGGADLVLPDATSGSGSRLEAAAVLGVAFALAWAKRGQPSPAEDRKRRRWHF
jgi:subtilase family serine protease